VKEGSLNAQRVQEATNVTELALSRDRALFMS
jgi:hypothetical protein